MYYIGALIWNLLNESGPQSVGTIFSYIGSINNKITINHIYYSCDWLYLLELITINEQGEIICI